MEKDVHRWGMPVDFFLLCEMDPIQATFPMNPALEGSWGDEHRPLQNLSPWIASLTVIGLLSFSLSAKSLVKPEGICWTTTVPGISGGSWVIIFRKATVPPVEAPIAKILSVVWRGNGCRVF
jgi:hypothetical protein